MEIYCEPDFIDMHSALVNRGFEQDIENLVRKHGRGGKGSTTYSSSSTNHTTQNLVKRLNNVRGEDEEDEKQGNRKKGFGDPDYDVIMKYRGVSMLSIAYDVRTGRTYVGYSGGGSSVFSNKISGNSGQQRRLYRVRGYLQNVQQRTRFNPANCSEVAALSLALSWGARAGDLFFISGDSNGNLRNPCANCVQWIGQYCYGYYHV